MTPRPVLTLDRLSIAFSTARGVAHAVRDVSLTIGRGEIVGLVGESGCGKSTLAYAVLGDFGGTRPKTAGSISYGGVEILSAGPAVLKELRGTRIAMVHQNPGAALTPTARIGRQLEEILVVHEGLARARARARVVDLLAKVRLPDPETLMERYPHQLSGGQQQRVVIAAALLGKPDLLVLDEPTNGLDVTVEASVIDLLQDLRAETGIAMLFIAHNLGLIARICDRVGVMYAGELVETADVDRLFHAPRHPYTVGLLRCVPRVDRPRTEHPLRPIPGHLPSPFEDRPGCRFADRCGFVEPRCTTERPEYERLGKDGVRCFRWREIDTSNPAADGAAPTPDPVPLRGSRQDLLSGCGLTVRYPLGARLDGAAVLDAVNIAVDAGIITAVVGESGSGKTTLGRALVGLAPISDGRLVFGGETLPGPTRRRSAFVHRALQMVFQDHSGTLNPSLSVAAIIARPLRLFGIVPRRKQGEETHRLLGAVGLVPSIAVRPPGQLSGGQKQRVAIARAFAGRPSLVVCDEITSALDVSVQASVLDFLLVLQRTSGTSLLFISHDLGVVRYLADEVVVMYLGRICERGPAEAVFAGPNHPYTQALLSAAPLPDPDHRVKGERLEGAVPSAADRPDGCVFHTRCPRKIGTVCETRRPPVREVSPGHVLDCHHEVDALAAFRQRSSTSIEEADYA